MNRATVPRVTVSKETIRLVKQVNVELISYKDLESEKLSFLMKFVKKCVDVEFHKGKKPKLIHTDSENQCRIVVSGERCNLIKGKANADQFCEKHKMILRKLQAYLNGRICAFASCKNGTDRKFCSVHQYKSENDEESQTDDDDDLYEDVGDDDDNSKLSDDEKEHIKESLIPLLEEFSREIDESDKKVIYIGATNRDPIKRCSDYDHFNSKPITYFVRDLVEESSYKKMKFIEHFSIAYLARKLGDHRLVNKVGGGGGTKKGKKEENFKLYALIWLDDEDARNLAAGPKVLNLQDSYANEESVPSNTTNLTAREVGVVLGLQQCYDLSGSAGSSLKFAEAVGFKKI